MIDASSSGRREVTRFAPSPTGLLHLGHGYSALFAWAAAAQSGGRFILRIEDIDIGRCKPEFEQAILEDIAWLGSGIGLAWEQPVRRQSEHMADYRDALDRLAEMGLLYPCFCTRREIMDEIEAAGGAPHGPDGPLYPGSCRGLSADERAARIAAGQAHALRIDVEKAHALSGALTWIEEGIDAGEVTATPEILGDAVLARKDVATSYHLAVTVDDALQGVTLVTRGEDLKHATHLHRLLQALLDLPVPRWRHHRLLTTEAGQRLAKRHRSLTLAALREAGHSPAEVRKMAGFEG
jgi:glutamyl-Q tRNA(Asp) synthetase